jgi:hypothetical protein
LTQCFGELKGLQRICGKVAASLRQTFPFGTGIISIQKRKKQKKSKKEKKKQEEKDLLTKVNLSHILHRLLFRQQFRTVHQKARVDNSITR